MRFKKYLRDLDLLKKISTKKFLRDKRGEVVG